jgi:hypothetical protein
MSNTQNTFNFITKYEKYDILNSDEDFPKSGCPPKMNRKKVEGLSKTVYNTSSISKGTYKLQYLMRTKAQYQNLIKKKYEDFLTCICDR